MPLFRVGLTASSLVMSSWVLTISKYWDFTAFLEGHALFDPPFSEKHCCYVSVGFAVVQLVHNCLLSSHWVWIHFLYSPPFSTPSVYIHREIGPGWALFSEWSQLCLSSYQPFNDHRGPSLDRVQEPSEGSPALGTALQLRAVVPSFCWYTGLC